MNRIVLSAVAGLVLASAILLKFSGDAGTVIVPVILNGLAGALVGLLADRSRSRPLTLLIGAVIGMLLWWFIGREGGAPRTSLLLGSLVGLGIAAVVTYWGRAQQRSPRVLKAMRSMPSPRGHQLSDADVLLLTRIEAGEHTFRPGSAPRRPGESFDALIGLLRSLRERGLIRLAESRIMQRADS